MTEPLPDFAIDRLLGDASSFLREKWTDSEPGVAGPPAEARIDPKYRIVRELGRGGMGIVYEAFDAELSRTVALKVLIGGRSDPALLARFQREAQAAARLTHPNIAAVYEATPDFIAMQLVDGVPLSRLPRDDRARLVRLVRDAARAVHFAHEHGIIHRDLKPQNLMVEDDRILVLDFGLAKERTPDAELTLSGHVLGSPTTMAPEQASGRVDAIDPRTDVYGLGATLFDLLAGRPPFVDANVARLLRSVIETDAPPIRRFAPRVPKDLESIVLQCLRKEPERRYQSAAMLADDLDRWLEGRPALARRPSLLYRASKFVRRRRAVVGTVSVAALILLIAAGVMVGERSKRRATEEALGLSEHVAAVLRDAELYRREGEMAAASSRLRAGLDACSRFLARHEVARAHYLRARLLHAAGRRDEAELALDRALSLDPALVEARLERGLLRARALSDRLGRDHPELRAADAGLPETLERERQDALRDLRNAAEAERIDRLRALLAQGATAWLCGRRGEARAHYQEILRFDALHQGASVGLARLELEEGDDDAALSRAMTAVDVARGFGPAYLARSREETSPVDRAIRQHALAAADDRIEAGDRSPTAFRERAGARLHLADVEGALADLRVALTANPSDALAYAHRGLIHAKRAVALAGRGESAAALDAWEASARDAGAALTMRPDLAAAWNNRGIARLEIARRLERRGEPGAAEVARRSALEDLVQAGIADPSFALAHINQSVWHRARARRLARAGEHELALGALDRASAALATIESDPPALFEAAEVAETRERIASANAGNRSDLRARSLAAWDAAISRDPENGDSWARRGLLHQREGRLTLARADFESALRLRLSPELRKRIDAANRANVRPLPTNDSR